MADYLNMCEACGAEACQRPTGQYQGLSLRYSLAESQQACLAGLTV